MFKNINFHYLLQAIKVCLYPNHFNDAWETDSNNQSFFEDWNKDGAN